MPPPIISFREVSFAYSGKPQDYLYTGLTFGIDSDSRIVLGKYPFYLVPRWAYPYMLKVVVYMIYSYR